MSDKNKHTDALCMPVETILVPYWVTGTVQSNAVGAYDLYKDTKHYLVAYKGWQPTLGQYPFYRRRLRATNE